VQKKKEKITREWGGDKKEGTDVRPSKNPRLSGKVFSFWVPPFKKQSMPGKKKKVLKKGGYKRKPTENGIRSPPPKRGNLKTTGTPRGGGKSGTGGFGDGKVIGKWTGLTKKVVFFHRHRTIPCVGKGVKKKKKLKIKKKIVVGLQTPPRKTTHIGPPPPPKNKEIPVGNQRKTGGGVRRETIEVLVMEKKVLVQVGGGSQEKKYRCVPKRFTEAVQK